MDSGACTKVCHTNRNAIKRPQRNGPYASRKNTYEPPAFGIAAPSSDHTNASSVASTAPPNHASSACGPPISRITIPLTTNGPIPTISIMLSATASFNPSPRSRPEFSLAPIASLRITVARLPGTIQLLAERHISIAQYSIALELRALTPFKREREKSVLLRIKDLESNSLRLAPPSPPNVASLAAAGPLPGFPLRCKHLCAVERLRRRQRCSKACASCGD